MAYLPQNPLRVFQLSHAVSQQFIIDFLDSRPEVLNWFALFPGCVLIVSRSDLSALTGIVHVTYPWLWFLLTEVDSQRANGFLNEQAWSFINQPKSSGRWE